MSVEDPGPVDVVAAGRSQSIGHYHYDIVSGQWTWDDELYRMHGYEPGEIAVDLTRILSHKHPDDRDAASLVIERALLNGEPFSTYQRIVARDGTVRNIVKVGAGVVDEHRNVVALDGFYIDLTLDVRRHETEAADEAVQAATAHRAAIEQAKGMIMVINGIDANAAFAQLRWWSMKRNIKLWMLAEGFVAAGMAGMRDDGLVSPDANVHIERLLEQVCAQLQSGAPAAQEMAVSSTSARDERADEGPLVGMS